MEREHKCEWCGKEFEPTCHKSRQKFCSAECRIKYHNAKRYYGGRVGICPECGEPVEQSRERGRWRRFCSDECRKEWWREYHKASPSKEPGARKCVLCGKEFTSDRWHGGEYCGRECAAAARHDPGHKRGMRRIQYTGPEEWKEQLHEASRRSPPPKRGKRVWLVCGVTSMYLGLDGLLGIIRYQLNHSPYDGSLYVFRDFSGTMIKYLEWDGAGFCLSKRRAQSGSYPWPPAEAGKVLEITEKEFDYLKSRSIVPCKEKKPRGGSGRCSGVCRKNCSPTRYFTRTRPR